jgi:hypothetical protein
VSAALCVRLYSGQALQLLALRPSSRSLCVVKLQAIWWLAGSGCVLRLQRDYCSHHSAAAPAAVEELQELLRTAGAAGWLSRAEQACRSTGCMVCCLRRRHTDSSSSLHCLAGVYAVRVGCCRAQVSSSCSSCSCLHCFHTSSFGKYWAF